MENNTLHVVDGDSTLDTLHEAGFRNFLNWRDVLHDGPVQASATPEERAGRRAAFLAQQGWTDEIEAREGFLARNQRLKEAAENCTLVLWCAAELFDQLHLLEIHALLRHLKHAGSLFLVQSQRSVPFLSPQECRDHYENRRPLSTSSKGWLDVAWQAFGSDSPEQLAHFVGSFVDPQLPYLKPALLRMCGEYPTTRDGLTLTERTVLDILATAGPQTPIDLFLKYGQAEAVPFMGDLSFWQRLTRLMQPQAPLIEDSGERPFRNPGGASPSKILAGTRLSINDFGRDVLARTRSGLENRHFDQWIGGVHLRNDALWLWDEHARIFRNHPPNISKK